MFLRLKTVEQLAALLAIVVLDAANADTINVPLDYKMIQKAIDAAQNGDEVVVAPGTYNEAIDYLGKSITVRSSGGPKLTTIDARGMSNTTVVTCEAVAEKPVTILQGFTIRGGTNGGMYTYFCTTQVLNCVFTENSSGWGGGLFNTFSETTITDCLFIGNNSTGFGGGLGNYTSNTTITNCEFRNNMGISGGAMDNWVGSVVVDECVFDDNTASVGGGIGGSSIDVIVMNCTFTHNTADAGGAINCEEDYIPTISDSIFCDNSPEDIAGIYNDNGGNCFAITCDDNNKNQIPDQCECLADINTDGEVTTVDLEILLTQWHTDPGGPPDLNGDGTVNTSDLLILLTNWGPCP